MPGIIGFSCDGTTKGWDRTPRTYDQVCNLLFVAESYIYFCTLSFFFIILKEKIYPSVFVFFNRFAILQWVPPVLFVLVLLSLHATCVSTAKSCKDKLMISVHK